MSNKSILHENLTFESALAELEIIVKKIESGQESLESSINSFERAVLLKAFCEQKLQEARLKIDKITKSATSETLETANIPI